MDGTSAFNTRTEQRRLLLLDPARGEERLMEIQQHDGVVVEVAGSQQGFSKRCGRREMCHGREREAPGLRYGCSSFSPLYIGPRERGRAQPCPFLQGRVRPRGEESILPKAPRRCLPPLGLFLSLISWRMGLLGLVPLAHIGQGAPPQPMWPPRAGGPPWWTPGPLRHSRYNTDKVRNFSGDQNKTSHI